MSNITVNKKRNRETVLIKITAEKLHELIGDVEIGVSRKELKNIILKQGSAAILSKAGL